MTSIFLLSLYLASCYISFYYFTSQKNTFCAFGRFVTLLTKSKFKFTFFWLLCPLKRYLSLLNAKFSDMVGSARHPRSSPKPTFHHKNCALPPCLVPASVPAGPGVLLIVEQDHRIQPWVSMFSCIYFGVLISFPCFFFNSLLGSHAILILIRIRKKSGRFFPALWLMK